jgi:hypothetical protein
MLLGGVHSSEIGLVGYPVVGSDTFIGGLHRQLFNVA